MAITNGYCSLAEIKAALRIPSADTVDDALLETAVESASRLVDGFAGRNFYANGTATRYYTPEDRIVCNVHALASIRPCAAFWRLKARLLLYDTELYFS